MTTYRRGAGFEHKVTADRRLTASLGKAPTSKLIEWCGLQCQDDYSYDGVGKKFSFKLKADAMMFKLAWG